MIAHSIRGKAKTHSRVAVKIIFLIMFDFLKSEKDILPVAVEQNEAPVMPSITDPKQLEKKNGKNYSNSFLRHLQMDIFRR